MPAASLVLPQNAVIMQEEEMRYVEGGTWKLYFGIGAASLWWVGYCAKTKRSNYVTKNGKKYYVEYSPSKGTVKFGNACQYVGSWGLNYVSKVVSIGSGIKGFIKLMNS